MCGNEAPYASKLPNDFKPTAHLSNADWAVLEKQYSTVDKKTIRFLKKTFDLHDIDRSESLDIEEIARALSFVHGRGTCNPKRAVQRTPTHRRWLVCLTPHYLCIDSPAYVGGW